MEWIEYSFQQFTLDLCEEDKQMACNSELQAIALKRRGRGIRSYEANASQKP